MINTFFKGTGHPNGSGDLSVRYETRPYASFIGTEQLIIL
jgi:hypothetical protein